MAPERPTGICPNCVKRTGQVGERCPGDVCSDKGYAFIPTPWYESAKEFATKKHRALDPLLGRCIDRYLLAGKLGEGGMGAVYLALQRPLGREVALKVISGMDLTPAAITRFEREARAISTLDHPNVVKLYDYGIGELEYQVPYMALEYVRHGKTLRRALLQIRGETGGQIPGRVIYVIFEQVLHALGAAHDLGIIHRDMKPDNVMLAAVHGNPYFVKVLDFGLAKAVSEVSGFDGNVSRTGQFLGTPHYMAPEQGPQKVRSDADGRADLYAVGVMLFEVFTGVVPFGGDTPLEVLARKVDPSFRPLDLPEAQSLPRQLKVFLAKGMSTKPEARFANAPEMLEALEKALSGRSATAVGISSSGSGSSDDRPRTPLSPMAQSPSPRTPLPSEEREPVATHQGIPEKPPTAPPSEILPSTLDDPRSRARTVRRAAWVLGPVVVLGVAAALFLAVPSGPSVERTETWTAIPKSEVPPSAPVAEPTQPPEPKETTPAPVAMQQAKIPQLQSPVESGPTRHLVLIETTPSGATVHVNGKLVGKSPVKYYFVTLSNSAITGDVEILARATGYEEIRRQFNLGDAVRAGRIDIALNRLPRATPSPRPMPSKPVEKSKPPPPKEEFKLL